MKLIQQVLVHRFSFRGVQHVERDSSTGFTFTNLEDDKKPEGQESLSFCVIQSQPLRIWFRVDDHVIALNLVQQT